MNNFYKGGRELAYLKGLPHYAVQQKLQQSDNIYRCDCKHYGLQRHSYLSIPSLYSLSYGRAK